MASKLFQLAQEAAQRLARERFQRSEMGRLVKEISQAAGRGRMSEYEVRRFSRRLSGLTGRRAAADMMRAMGLDEIERYAKKSGLAGAAGDFFGMLGPVGKLIKTFLKPGKRSGNVSLQRELAAAAGLLRAFGHVVIPKSGATRQEQEQVADLLRSLGWKVEPPPESPDQEPETPERVSKPGRPRKTIDVDYGGPKLKNRVRKDDPLASGEMIPVQSSNVHSIGFRIDPDSSGGMHSSTGTLLIRFLGKKPGGKRSGEGPLYEYYDVPAALFQQFRRAASKGIFVWDNVRVRGTVSGHRFSYDLAGITGGYVPRQAGLKRGQQGEFYMPRRFKDQTGRVFNSPLAEQQVKLSGPNRAGPNRAGPNRGRPNRGKLF